MTNFDDNSYDQETLGKMHAEGRRNDLMMLGSVGISMLEVIEWHALMN